jgi:TldD protein
MLVRLASAAPGEDDVVLSALQAELVRTLEAWKGDAAAPYFLSYRVRETRRWSISARFGALASSTENATRTLDVSARVGSPELDSTHPLKGDFVALGNFHMGQGLPLDGTALALQEAVWRATSKELADAQERWLRVQANFVVKVVDDHPSDDFTVMPPVVDVGEKASLLFEPSRYEPMLVELSAALDRHPDIYRSSADLHAVSQTEYFVSSEGTVLRHPREWLRISLQASTTLQDGAEIVLYRWKDVSDTAQLPSRAELDRWTSELQRDVLELRQAPKGEPYSGPVLLRGRAAGVFVHEVLGHRVEGHRQKDDEEGQTFTDKVGQAILPPFVTVYDDPTLQSYAGEQLNGHYLYDQEGVPAQKALLVDKGVLQGFLMSRSPIEGQKSSNGHGRAQSYAQPVARMANTILETSQPLPMTCAPRTAPGG